MYNWKSICLYNLGWAWHSKDTARCQKLQTEREREKMEVEERGPGVGQGCLKSWEYSPCCMSFHRTQYLELSSKVTRQLCFELLTWGTEREEQHETVAGKEPLEPGLPLPLLFPPPRGGVQKAELGWEGKEGGSSGGSAHGSLELCSQGPGDGSSVGMLRTEQARCSL